MYIGSAKISFSMSGGIFSIFFFVVFRADFVGDPIIDIKYFIVYAASVRFHFFAKLLKLFLSLLSGGKRILMSRMGAKRIVSFYWFVL